MPCAVAEGRGGHHPCISWHSLKPTLQNQVGGFLEPPHRLLWTDRSWGSCPLMRSIESTRTHPRLVTAVFCSPTYNLCCQSENTGNNCPQSEHRGWFFLPLIKESLQLKGEIIKKLKPYVMRFKNKQTNNF